MDDEIRANLVETAIKFLQNPKVKDSPLDQKKAFLSKKGLTDKEIDVALGQSGTSSIPSVHNVQPPIYPSPQSVAYHQVPPQSFFTRARDLATTVVVFGSLTYGLYNLLKSLWPQWFKKSQQEVQTDRLNNNLECLQRTLEDGIGTIDMTMKEQRKYMDELNQRNAINKANQFDMTERVNEDIKNELKSLKGLLLSRNQFALPPAGTTPSLPAWQKTSTTQDTSSSTPAVNGGAGDAGSDQPVDRNELSENEHKNTADNSKSGCLQTVDEVVLNAVNPVQ